MRSALAGQCALDWTTIRDRIKAGARGRARNHGGVQPSPPPAVVAPAPARPGGPSSAAMRPWNTAAWLAQHETFLARARRGGVDVLFLGDSISEYFATRGHAVWARRIAPLGAVADFGIAGDRTQFLLWRVRHGELDGIAPRAVVVMIGTNDLATAAPDDVAHGVAAIVAEVRTRVPHATVLLNALLPRSDPNEAARANLPRVNALLARLADGRHVRWIDAGPGFLTAGGTTDPALLPDGLHPSPAGYEVWAAALRPSLLDALAR